MRSMWLAKKLVWRCSTTESVTEVYVDRARHKDFVGNIYKGKV